MTVKKETLIFILEWRTLNSDGYCLPDLWCHYSEHCKAIIRPKGWPFKVLVSGISSIIIMNCGNELYQIIESRKCFLFWNWISWTRPAIFNLKMLSYFRIPNSVKYGAGLSLLFATKMHRRQLFWLTLSLLNLVWYAVPQPLTHSLDTEIWV